MWDVLKQTDIEQARQQIQLCRDETLRRHAEEIQRMDSDQAEIETLDHLIDAFSDKFTIVPASAQAAPAPPAPAKRHEHAVLPPVKHDEHPVLTSHHIDRPSPKVRHHDRPDHSRTNFDTVSRALAKVERGW
jgi:hypothetical protein